MRRMRLRLLPRSEYLFYSRQAFSRSAPALCRLSGARHVNVGLTGAAAPVGGPASRN